MNRNPRLCALSLLTLATFAGATAFAHEPTGGDPKTPAPQHDMAAMQKGDHAKMAANEFATLDRNRDGQLQKAEIPANHAMRAHFPMLDTNKNGSLSQAEFAKHHAMTTTGPDNKHTDKGAMDHGKKGHQAMPDFGTLDKNKDGKLSKSELPGKHPLAAHFGMLDTDKDGSLSKAEYASHRDGM